MNLVIIAGCLFLCFDSATGTRCLTCTSLPSRVPCVTASTCSTAQECYAKYVLKPDGPVMYEFGCQDSQTCPGQMGTHALIGKRATGDTELCYKCCQGDMCNQGTLCTGPLTTGTHILNPTTVSIITATSPTTTQTTPTTTVITPSMPKSTSITTATIASGGDVCLTCTDSPVARECLYTMTCASHESCYADAFENPNGDIVFNLGCRDRQLCGSSGKREVVNRSNGNTQLCAQCCFGNLCNAALCGQTGLPSVGPVCFKCDQANTPSSCNTIALCGRGDVCHVEKTTSSLTHASLYKSGCLHKTICDRHAQILSLIGRKRYDNTVKPGNDLQIQCCDSNLCNHGNGSSASGSASTTGAVAPTHSSLSAQQSICSTNPCIHGSCFSASTDYFCQCEQDWQGKNCDQHQGPCTGSPCIHGRCFESSTDYACQCENGWQGKNCDQNINYCTSNPCLHGTCSNGASSYVCQCSVGWQGTNCDQASLIHGAGREYGIFPVSEPNQSHFNTTRRFLFITITGVRLFCDVHLLAIQLKVHQYGDTWGQRYGANPDCLAKYPITQTLTYEFDATEWLNGADVSVIDGYPWALTLHTNKRQLPTCAVHSTKPYSERGDRLVGIAGWSGCWLDRLQFIWST
ncbi:neurogenic locus notch homolog protein 1-like isoform X24 [Dreissena polymorpha]|uniref:neurogenic locus notch homolog protein 1-like isoform X24 n=1 Tax=Dreissena polymorpha TaxID=45954 RepID=UPI00226486DB|nr:neurogenic locus notch homolog protein 1-like isoform X24 [Dreissena polymorpha]